MKNNLPLKFLFIIPATSLVISPIVGCGANKKTDDVIHVEKVEIEHYTTEEETEYYDKDQPYNYGYIDDQKQLGVTVLPENATNKTVTWKVEDESIATIDQNGNVTPKKQGLTTIEAVSSDGNKQHKIYFGVIEKGKDTEPTGIEFVATPPETVHPNQEWPIEAKVLPEEAYQIVEWSSSDESVATVERDSEEYNKAKIKTLSVGETKIKVETINGISKEYTLKVSEFDPENNHVTGLKLNKDKIELAVNFEPVELIATVEPENATYQNVFWEIKDKDIADYRFSEWDSTKIKIIPKAPGETTITCTTQGTSEDGEHITETIPITITGETHYAESIIINEKNEKNQIVLPEEKSMKLSATVGPANATNKRVEWQSSDPKIVKVDKDSGLIYAINEGQATITAKAVGKDPNKQDVIDKCDVVVLIETCRITLTTDDHGTVNPHLITTPIGTSFAKAIEKVSKTPNIGYEFSHWAYENGEKIDGNLPIKKHFTAKAIFEKAPKITIIKSADLTTYVKGDYFDPIGLEVVREYEDGNKKPVGRNEWTTNIKYNSKLETVGEQTVTISLIDNPLSKVTYKINVLEKADVVAENIEQNFGDIRVKYKLMSNQECVLTNYVSGEGIVLIPDYVVYQGNNYYIKRIPNNWSNDEDDIRGFAFHGNPDETAKDTQTKHLKVIESRAFYGTNALDYWVDNYGEILKFPEGLVEIGDEVFSHTYWSVVPVSGYDFPSTIRKIGNKAFGNEAPVIDQKNGISKLIFRCPRRDVNISQTAFECTSRHNVSVICGPTQEDANDWANYFSSLESCFEKGAELLVPVPIICKVSLKAVEHGSVKQNPIEIPGGTTWEEAKSRVIDAVKAGDGYHFRECQTEDGTVLKDTFVFKKDLTLNVIFSQNSGIESILLSKNPDLQIYEKGEYFDPIGAEISASYSDGTVKPLDESKWTTNIPYNSKLETLGEQTITFSLIDDPTKTIKYPITVINKATEIAESNNTAIFGDICVQFKLMSNQECVLTKRVSGKGNLLIPDYVIRQGKKWYIKRIPENWSSGSNKITGLDFHGKASGGDDTITRVKHLKVIEGHAFESTNALDHWLEHNEYILKFPEGLVEIGNYAFSGTDHTFSNHIVGYDFPSTIRKIGERSFGISAPFINGDKNNESRLVFRCPKSLVDIHEDAFVIGTWWHKTKAVYAPTYQMACDWARFLSNSGSFKTDSFKTWLVPKVL